MKKVILSSLLLTAFCAAFTLSVAAQKKEFNLVTKQLTNHFQAKKVNIPFLWLAKMAVGVVRPAGVRSFNVTMYRDIKFDTDSYKKFTTSLRETFDENWNPIISVRSKNGQYTQAYAREENGKIRVIVVNLNNTEATVVRAKLDPEKLVDFMSNPSILGISLSDEPAT